MAEGVADVVTDLWAAVLRVAEVVADLWVVVLRVADVVADLWVVALRVAVDAADDLCVADGLAFTVAVVDLLVAVVAFCEAAGVVALLLCTVAVDALRVLLLALTAWLPADDLLVTDGLVLLWLWVVAAVRDVLLRVSCVLA